MSQETLSLKKANCAGGKHSKICFTGPAAASMNSRSFLCLPSAKNHAASKEQRSFLADIEGKRLAGWIRRLIFEEWARVLDGKFEKEQHKMVLIVDSWEAHPEIVGLRSFLFFFLPPNTTPSLQPMDQGIIRSLKAKYRNKVVQKMIDAIDSDKP